MSKIYDCFTFFNEVELLDLRLELLYDYVDYFVIVESDATFSGLAKPWYFHPHRYRKYLDKILYRQFKSPRSFNPWDNEKAQRDEICNVVADSYPKLDDLIIIGDLDEFLRPEALNFNAEHDFYAFRVPYFNFKFNYLQINSVETYAVANVGTRFSQLKSPNSLRMRKFQLGELPYGYDDGFVKVIEHGGWHFTYLGDNETIRNKIKSFSHQELNTDRTLSSIDVDSSIRTGRGFNPSDGKTFTAVKLDEYFPPNLPEKFCILDAVDPISKFLPGL